MKTTSFIITAVLLSACVRHLTTFETNLERETYYKKGSSSLQSFSADLHDTINLVDFHFCSYLREARWHKGIQFKKFNFDTLAFMSNLIDATDSLIRANGTASFNHERLTFGALNHCNQQKADYSWSDFVANALLNSSSVPEGDVGMKLIGRTVTYSSPQLADTFSPHIMTSSGNTEYYISTRWCVIIYEGSKEVYRGNSLFKDYLIYPDSKEFNYRLTRQNIDSLMSLSMAEYFTLFK